MDAQTAAVKAVHEACRKTVLALCGATLVEIVGPPRRSGSDSGSWEVPVVVLASGAQRTAGPFPSREACREAFGL